MRHYPQRVVFSHQKTSDCFSPCYSDEAKGDDFSIGNGEMAFQRNHTTSRIIWTVKLHIPEIS